MSILAKLTTDDAIQDERDVVGGGYQPLESGLYNHTVTLAYLNPADSGALGLVVHFKDDANRELRQTFWLTSGTAKGGKNYYERDGQKHYLPGFIQANSLCLLTVGKGINEMDTEEKVVNVYSRAAGTEVPTKVHVLPELLGKEIISGVIKQIVDRNVKDSSGNYVPSGETREENEIDKFFRASDRKTTVEIRGQAQEATFIDTWEKRWAGEVRDRSTKTSGIAGAPRPMQQQGIAASSASQKPTTSLFA